MPRTRTLLAALVVTLSGALGACGPSRAADGSPSAPPAASAPADAGGASAPPATPPSDTVHIVLTVIPATAKAKVLWGKKLLGMVEKKKPLVLTRPRDSGPLDIVVRADGFLPVQTRLYTFADGKLSVKLTPPEEQKTLLGYREPPPPEAPPGAAPDGGAPATPPGEAAIGADGGAPP